MSVSNKQKGYASLMALVCSAILLNLALGQFAYTRGALQQRGEDTSALLRRVFRSNSLPEFWRLSETLIETGAITGEFVWEGEMAVISRSIEWADNFSIEKIEVEVLNHPEWGNLTGTRLSTESQVFFFNGVK